MKRWKRRPEGSNWGDFGEDDQLGMLNLVTQEHRFAAAKEIRTGHSFNLSLPLDYPGGSVLMPSRTEPKIIAVERSTGEESYNFPFSRVNDRFHDVVSDDAVLLFNQYSTQWDALGHWGQEFDADDDGVAEVVYYNGFRGGIEILGATKDEGPYAAALDIDQLATSSVQGRGVLLDLEAVYGHEKVTIGYEALMNAIDRQNVDIKSGDFLCIHTGFSGLLLSMQKKPVKEVLDNSCAALDGSDDRLLNWIAASGIVAICADNMGVEHLSYTPRIGGDVKSSMMPLHEFCLFKRGIPLGELWHFGDLVKWLRENQRSSFFLTAPPLRLRGCVGSPVTPIATV